MAIHAAGAKQPYFADCHRDGLYFIGGDPKAYAAKTDCLRQAAKFTYVQKYKNLLPCAKGDYVAVDLWQLKTKATTRRPQVGSDARSRCALTANFLDDPELPP
jgi:hypothetical protein